MPLNVQPDRRWWSTRRIARLDLPPSSLPPNAQPLPPFLHPKSTSFAQPARRLGTSLHCSGHDIGHEGLSRLVDILARVNKQGLYSPTFSHPAPPIPCHTLSSTDAKVSYQSHKKPQILRFSATHAVKPKPVCAPFTALSSERVVARKALDKLGEQFSPQPSAHILFPLPEVYTRLFLPFWLSASPVPPLSLPFPPLFTGPTLSTSASI
jgi:hypothetical protein